MNIQVELHNSLGANDLMLKKDQSSQLPTTFENLSEEDNCRENEIVAALQEAECEKRDKNIDSRPAITRTACSPSLNRKYKPPNLELSGSPKRAAPKTENQFSSSDDSSDDEIESKSAQTSPSDEDTFPPAGPESPSTPMVTLPKHMVKMMDAGLSSPLVRRSSRIEEILNLPDVKAAIVRDEGFEMRSIFYKNTGKALAERLQTPGDATLEDQFKFEGESPPESESVSESDASSIMSSRDVIVDSNAGTPEDGKEGLRLRIGVLQDAKSVENPLEKIADSLGPSTLFNNSSKRDRTAPTHSSKKDKKRNRSKSQEQQSSSATLPSKQTPLLSRFKFSSMKESRSRLEGWDSLTRALARVGAAPPMPHISFDDIDINPKLNPILKRSLRGLNEKNGNSYLQEPGGRVNLPKKTVSFSRLPTEAKVKNAVDCVSRMGEGQQFVKLRSNSRAYNRLYWFDEDHNCLRWEPSKKDSGKARLLISQIRDVRAGKNSELFLTSDIACHFPDEYSFSIFHGEGKSLDLVANSADEANIWITGLRCLMTGEDVESLRNRSEARDNWISTVFDGADINGDGYLDEDESVKLLTNLSDGIRELSIKQRLQEYFNVKTEDKTGLSREEFIRIFKDVATRPEVYFLLVKYSSSHDRLSVNDLATFLESEQGLKNVTKNDCLEIITKFEPSEVLRSIPALGIDGFTKYLISENCNLFNPKHLEVCQDMTQPLSHYYIASSHNTYLMEDQIAGPSDISAYVRALLRCCRSVELDCWDGANGEPVVCQGHTKSNPIPFVHVIKAINESAFHNSPYPVVMCIENHCSKEQQKKMAQVLKTVLGDKLFAEPVKKFQLPSPENLKNKIVIRGKKLPPECSDDTGYVTEEDEGIEATPSYTEDSSEDPTNRVKGKQVLTREMSDVTVIGVNSLKSNLQSHQNSHNCQHSCSFHENFANELVKDSPEEFVSHTKSFLTRVYPSGLRTDSGNFNPQDYWNCGVQIASLNYQTPGLMMDINDGKFAMNGGCGYVLKPTVMREKLAYFNAEATEGLPSVPAKLLHLRIISGQNFPKPRGGGARGHVIDPYVLIELFGFPPDCSDQRTSTALSNSGDSPFFDELFEFRLSLPSLALVRFVVLDDDYIGDEFIGQYTIPFECLQPGYRHLKLRSLFDEPLDGATLFVHVAISDLDLNTTNPAASSPNPLSSGTPKLSKRPSQVRLQKQRARKEIFSVHIYELGIPDVDLLFRSAAENLQLAASLCGGLRHSLASLRDACGAPSLSSIRQCVRALAKRIAADSLSEGSSRVKRKPSSLSNENGTSKKRDVLKKSTSGDVKMSLRRQPSDTSQSSNDSGTATSIQVQFMRSEKRIWLEWKGAVSSSDAWKKIGIAVDALVANCLLVIEKSMNCCNFLTSIYDKTELIFDERADAFKQSVSNSEFLEMGANNTPQNRKQSKAKKHPFLGAEVAGKRAPTVIEHFIWNCSSVKGQRDALYSCHERAEEILTDLWAACVQCGLAGTRPSGIKPNGSVPLLGQSANENSNNNSPLMTSTKQSRRRKGRLVRAGSSFTRLPSRKPKLKRSLSDEVLPVA